MFYQNLDRICRSRGTSVSALAHKFGKGRSTPSGWKVNKNIPNEKDLEKFAEELNCSVAEFFLADGEYLSGQLDCSDDFEVELMQTYRDLSAGSKVDLIHRAHELRRIDEAKGPQV